LTEKHKQQPENGRQRKTLMDPHGQPQEMTPYFEMRQPVSKIVVRNLNFHYGNHQALFDNNLEIAQNRITAIIGPSGCGKSTHIRVYNRIYELYADQRAEGEILLDGVNILDPAYDLMELRRCCGMVFQRPVPFPLSIFDNVAFGLKQHYRLSRAEVADSVEEALRAAALWDEVKDRLQRPGTSLSGGQQQRLCIARAVVVKPEVILLDEPCSAIDPVSTLKIEELILALKDRYTIAIVTHNMAQAQRIADFTAYFYRGHILDFGATKDIFTKYSLMDDVPRMEHLDEVLREKFDMPSSGLS
jgi:phosphate transport system ATP-binding protein